MGQILHTRVYDNKVGINQSHPLILFELIYLQSYMTLYLWQKKIKSSPTLHSFKILWHPTVPFFLLNLSLELLLILTKNSLRCCGVVWKLSR